MELVEEILEVAVPFEAPNAVVVVPTAEVVTPDVTEAVAPEDEDTAEDEDATADFSSAEIKVLAVVVWDPVIIDDEDVFTVAAAACVVDATVPHPPPGLVGMNSGE